MTTEAACHSESLLFMRQWLRAPLRVASVVPSGRALAALITRDIGPETGRVLELGPGTGVFTRMLVARGVPQESLTLVETDPRFAALLAARFARARILSIDAARLEREHLDEGEAFGAAVSGLPLLSMPLATVEAILAAAFSLMRPGAHLYQFTYGPRCPVPVAVRENLGLSHQKIGKTVRNFPPATVYRLSQALPQA